MAPDANFESMSYNPFTVNDNFFNSESDPDVNFYSNISPLATKYFNPNEIRDGFDCLYKKGFSVLHINIMSINKNSETFKNFYSKLNCTFSVICFSETWATDNSICNDSNFQIENYTVLHQDEFFSFSYGELYHKQWAVYAVQIQSEVLMQVVDRLEPSNSDSKLS